MIDHTGQQLGKYRLIGLLGRGGFAEVYLGEHVYLKTQAAVKILQAHLVNAEEQADFLREAQTVARLAHPHIVRILDFGVDGQMPYLALEYAPGGTLHQRHPRGERLELATVGAYVRQVAEALQHIHNEKLIHRDVKPENMLVGKSNEILLGDFGIALVTHSSHSQSRQNVVGTVAYMAPEQIQGQPRQASDQYALAIVVYEWLCGERPFSGSFTEVCTQHLFAPVPSLRTKVKSIALEVERVIMAALAKDPKERFATVQAFATALEQASKSQPVVTSLQVVSAPPPLASSLSLDQRAVVAAHPAPPPTSTLPTANVIPLSGRISRRTLLTAGGIGVGAVVVGGAFLAQVLSQASHARDPLAIPTPPLPKHLLFRYQGHKLPDTDTSGGTVSLLWSPDGTRILSTNEKTVQVWDAFNGKHASTYHLPQSSTSIIIGKDFDLAWTPGGPCLAWRDGKRNLVHVINVMSGLEVTVYRGHANASESIAGAASIAWSPDGTRIASTAQMSDSPTIITRVWDATSGRDTSSFVPSVPKGHFASINLVAWSPDGSFISSPDNISGLIYVWNPATGQIISVFSKHTAELFAVSQDLKMTLISPLVWAPNSKQVVSVASNSGGAHMVRVWDVKNGNQIFAKESDAAKVAWPPQSFLFAVSVDGGNSPVEFWNASNGQVAFTHHYNFFAWSPDGKRIASDLERDREPAFEALNLWDGTTGAHLASYDAASENMSSLTWSPDGKYIATAGDYGTIDIWQV